MIIGAERCVCWTLIRYISLYWHLLPTLSAVEVRHHHICVINVFGVGTVSWKNLQTRLDLVAK